MRTGWFFTTLYTYKCQCSLQHDDPVIVLGLVFSPTQDSFMSDRCQWHGPARPRNYDVTFLGTDFKIISLTTTSLFIVEIRALLMYYSCRIRAFNFFMQCSVLQVEIYLTVSKWQSLKLFRLQFCNN